jgi:hypothetical protein
MTVRTFAIIETQSYDSTMVSYFSRDSTYLNVMMKFLIYFFIKKNMSKYNYIPHNYNGVCVSAKTFYSRLI